MGFGHDRPGIGHTEVDALDIFDVHQVRLELDDAVDIQQALFENLVLGIEQAFLPLGMRRADGPVKGREKDQACPVWLVLGLKLPIHKSSRESFSVPGS